MHTRFVASVSLDMMQNNSPAKKRKHVFIGSLISEKHEKICEQHFQLLFFVVKPVQAMQVAAVVLTYVQKRIQSHH